MWEYVGGGNKYGWCGREGKGVCGVHGELVGGCKKRDLPMFPDIFSCTLSPACALKVFVLAVILLMHKYGIEHAQN